VSGLSSFKNFLISDHWLRRYCILSGGVFYSEPRCTILQGYQHWRGYKPSWCLSSLQVQISCLTSKGERLKC